ncbi:MAG: ribonuclease T2 [Rhodospirillales bacterium]
MRGWLGSWVIFGALLAAFAPAPAVAQQQAVAGKFDYYLLTLSWSPQYCAVKGKGDAEQCAPERRYTFVAHGLWPQYEKGGYPSRCSTRERIDGATIDAQLDIMPSAGLVKHEWSVHGVCSGVGALAYFADLRQAFQRIVLPDFYQRPTGKLSRLPSQMKREIAAANPWLPENAMAVVCDGQYLNELRICLDKNLNPRACSAEVRQASCREREFIVRPVR